MQSFHKVGQLQPAQIVPTIDIHFPEPRSRSRHLDTLPLFASCDGWRKEEARFVVMAKGLTEKRVK
jgi:hypothetical protein